MSVGVVNSGGEVHDKVFKPGTGRLSVQVTAGNVAAAKNESAGAKDAPVEKNAEGTPPPN